MNPTESTVKAEPVPFLNLQAQYEEYREEAEPAVLELLRSQQMVLGPEVEGLEREIADYCGAKFAVGVSSGTDALLLALMALGIGPGDEVIVPTYTFFATAGSVARVGAKPVFVDIERGSYNIDVAQLEAALTSRTRAIMPVHLFGRCAEMAPILEIAEKRGLPVIEDAAQAIGSEYGERRAGSMGRIGCLSFYPGKNLGAVGDAGMVVTNDEELARKMRILRVHGAENKYFHTHVGGNFRLDAIQALILRIKLKRLDGWTEKRQANASEYRRLFKEAGLAGGPITLPEPGEHRHVYNQFVVAAERRDELQRHLGQAGIGSAVYYPLPLHRQECFLEAGETPPPLPISDWASEHTLALPAGPELTAQQRERVVEAIAAFYG